MKKLLNLLYILLMVGMLVACDKSFLEADPYSFVQTDEFYKTEADMETALVGCYNMLNTSNHGRVFGEEMLHMLNAGNDECVSAYGAVNTVTPFGSGSYTAAETELKDKWEALYAGINRCNHLLNKIDNMDLAPSLSAKRRGEIKGEALFLRGFYHMYLALMFGGVPVNTEPDPDFLKERQPLQQVYKQILQDFQDAFALLPHRATINGRANKWTTAGYRAKIYAYLAACKENNVGADLTLEINHFNWVDAGMMYDSLFAVTQRIMDESGYKLTDKYNYLFRETTRQWQYEECLFTVEGSSSTTNTVANRLNNAWLPWGNANTRGGSSSKWFVPTTEVLLRYFNGDPRRNYNHAGAIPAGNNAGVEDIEGVRYYVPANVNRQVSGYGVAKYRYRDPALKTIPAYLSDGAIPLLRFADILLLHGEAQYYKGDETGARDMLLQVRERAAKSAANPTTALTNMTNNYKKDDFMEELLEERSRELCYELGIRRFDLIRFGQLTAVIENLDIADSYHAIQSVPALKTNWKPYKIWFPIPTAERDLNQNLTQNDGY